jgi:hypothetical protein
MSARGEVAVLLPTKESSPRLYRRGAGGRAVADEGQVAGPSTMRGRSLRRRQQELGRRAAADKG